MGVYATLMVLLGNSTGSLAAGIVLSLVITVMIGIINGVAGEKLNIHPIVPSLVFMMILNGIRSIVYNKMGTRNMSLVNVDYSLFKQSWFMLLVLVLEVLVVGFLFNFTRFGKNARAIGANKTVAEQCGINVVKYKVICYVITGICVVLDRKSVV